MQPHKWAIYRMISNSLNNASIPNEYSEICKFSSVFLIHRIRRDICKRKVI